MSPKLSRRRFLQLSTVGAATLVLAGCKWPRRWEVLEPYVTPPEEQLTGQATWYASTCRQCPAGCGIIVRIMNGRAVKIEGNPHHPLNQGKLCARGQAGLQVLYNPDRLQGPQTQSQPGSKAFTSISWEEGIRTLGSKLQAAGGKTAILLGSTVSGHAYDLFSKLATALGAPAPVVFDLYSHFNGYSSLVQSSQDIFGSAQLPAYRLDNADAVFSFGGNFSGAWLSATRYGIEFGKLRRQALGKRGYLVQLESRLSPTGSKADRWVPLRPGSEATAARAILSLIASQEVGPADRVSRAKALNLNVDINQAAAACDIPAQDLQDLARIFATAPNAVAIPGEALATQPNAADQIAAVQALNLVAGAPTGTGGLTFSTGLQQAAYRKQAFSGYDAVQQLISSMAGGQVDTLLVYGANPAYDLPPQSGFAAALKKVPFVVSFASILDETAAQAHLVLPDRTYLESWGYEETSPDFGAPALGSQQPVVSPLFDLRSAADVILAVAATIPAAATAMPWKDEVEFLKALVATLPGGDTDPGKTWANILQAGGYFPAAQPQAAPITPTSPQITAQPPQYLGDAAAYPYYLQLYLSDLLSDGRGASQPWLQGSPDASTTIAWQTWVEMNPATAQKLGIALGDVVKITSAYGEVEAAVYPYPAIRPDTIAMPLGQGHTELGRYASGRGVNAVALGSTENGELSLSNLRVKVTPTGRNQTVATFEYTLGVDQGFANKGFPGD